MVFYQREFAPLSLAPPLPVSSPRVNQAQASAVGCGGNFHVVAIDRVNRSRATAALVVAMTDPPSGDTRRTNRANLPVHLFRFRNVAKKVVANLSSGAIFPPTFPTFTPWSAYAFP